MAVAAAAAAAAMQQYLFEFLLIGATTVNALSVLAILVSAVVTMVRARWTRHKIATEAVLIHELSKQVDQAAIPAQVLLALCHTKGIRMEQVMDWFEEDLADLAAVVYQRFGRNATVHRFVNSQPSFLRYGYSSHPYFGTIHALHKRKQQNKRKRSSTKAQPQSASSSASLSLDDASLFSTL